MYVTQQTLTYVERQDDIATVAHALDLLREKDLAGAARVLTIYMDVLQAAQQPRVVDYDPRADMAALARR